MEPHASAPDEPADEVLVRRAQLGDEEAFTGLMLRHRARLLATVRTFSLSSAEAEMLWVQIVAKVRSSLALFQGRSLFFHWLHQIALNMAINRARRRGPDLALPA